MYRQRRAFKVTVLMEKNKKIKDIVREIAFLLAAQVNNSFLTNVKVTYLRKSPWWKFWKRN